MQQIFEYEAIVPNGESIKGLYRGTKENFERMITQKKLTLVSLKEKKEKLDLTKFSKKDFLAFIEELYYLTQSGMPIDKSLKLLIQTSKKESQIRIINSILSDLKDGAQLSTALSKAFEKEKLHLDTLAVSFISTSEDVGSLANGLKQLFEYLSFQNKIRSDIKQALSYPLFLMGMSVFVSFLIFFLIIPKFSTIFTPDEFEKLPALSHAVLSLGNTLDHYMMESLFGISLFIVLLIYGVKKLNINWFVLLHKIPKVSTVVSDLQLTIVYSTLNTMLVGGLELDKALSQMRKIDLLPELKDLLKNTLFEIKRGEKLSNIFAISSIIPSSDIALISVGESSASLDKVFASLSKRHSEAFDQGVKSFLAILEPAVIVGLGVFIAVIVVAIMMAVMSITDIAG